MPLRDHFRSPVNDKHSWDEVHGQWPGEIVRTLFDILPEGYQASPKIQIGSPSEVDIGTYNGNIGEPWSESGGGGVATLPAIAPTFTIEADLSEQDQYEVLIHDVERGRRLVAAIEIVSPSNKDRPASREKFIDKVEALLQNEVCVCVVDPVTLPKANLYSELMKSFGRSDPQLATPPSPTYAVTLVARKRFRRPSLVGAWYLPMAVGQTLPVLPLWLSSDLRVMCPLETSYQETCRLLRVA